MWHKPCRTFHPWCPCIKTRCLSQIMRATSEDATYKDLWLRHCMKIHRIFIDTCCMASLRVQLIVSKNANCVSGISWNWFSIRHKDIQVYFSHFMLINVHSIPSTALFSQFSEWSDHYLSIEYHIYIWLVFPQIIKTKASNSYFSKL